MTERQHILTRATLHFCLAPLIWYLVLKLLTEPLSNGDPNLVAKIMATAFLLAVIAGKEIFDASKLAVLRGSVIEKILKTSQTPPKQELISVMNDPRYTLKKSLYDLVSWGAGITVIIIFIEVF